MSIRKVQGSPDKAIIETMKDDILNHSEDTTYEVLFIVAALVDYDYHVTCENFATVCKDPDYISQCIIQAKYEARGPNVPKHRFPNPQPFKAIRVPKEQTAESAS
jgi:hypothetical protein